MRSDFRAGLVRVAALGKQVFSGWGTSASMEFPASGRWLLLAAAGVTLTVLLIAAWYAGRESAGLEAQRANAELNHVAQQLASTQLALAQQKAKSDQLEKALSASGKAARLAFESKLKGQLLEAQAEANQYKSILDREREFYTTNSRLADTLAQPGARLLPLKGAEGASRSTAYALMVESSRLVLVASNLPEMADSRQLQLWIVRKQEPKLVSAGVFRPDHERRVFMSFEESSVLSDIASVVVTEEPEGGSPAPTGPKVLEGVNAAPEPTRSRVREPGSTEASLPVGSSSPYRHPGTSR